MHRVLGLMTCFNRKEKTINSIISLIKNNPDIMFRFIVVDDNSSDGTPEELRKIDEVRVIQGNGSLYYSGGMRAAIDEALKEKEEYEYCLLFNDDVDFFPHALEKMADDRSADILVGATCDNDGALSYGGVIRTSRLRPSYEIIDWTSAQSESCDTFNANCVLIKWAVFENLGNMDPVYTHSMGDFDYGFMASKKGYSIKVHKGYIGTCIDNPVSGGWRDKTLPRLIRIKKKESPKGLPTKEWFHYLNKNYSFVTACIYSVIPYVRIILKK